MAPGTRRANRAGYAEHDDFEGLPVRQWRQDWVTVAPPDQQEQQQQNDVWAIELIHGMPKDSSLLPPHTQELLRAARSGRLYKRPPPEEEEADAEAAVPEKPEKKEEDLSSKGFSVKLWKQIARNAEDTGLSRLAKRRKGTITIASKTVEDKIAGPTVTRATVRRIDAAGNPYTEEVTLAEGQQVNGEIISTRVETTAVAPPELTPHAPPQAKKRNPPPKRKRAGPGRGRRRGRIPISTRQSTGAAPNPTDATIPTVKAEENANVVKATSEAPTNQDSEMADGDDNDDDDDDDGEDGEDGDDGDEGEGDESGIGQQLNKATPAATENPDKEMTDAIPQTNTTHNPDQMDIDSQEPPKELETQQPSLPAPTTAPAPPDSVQEGSPLKQVALPPPTEPVSANDVPSTIVEPAPAPPKEEVEPSRVESEEKKEAVEPETPVVKPEPSVPSTLLEEKTAPVEETAPVQETAPVEETAAVEETAPVQETAPAEERKPAEETASAEESKIVKESAPVEDTILPDAPSADTLLPPPPDQVGNISSPRASPKIDSAPAHSPASAPKSHDGTQPFGESVSEKASVDHPESASTEDIVKPEDSVSMGVPRTESGAPSEAATGSIGGTEPEAKVEAPQEPQTEDQDEKLPDAPEAEASTSVPAPATEEPDLLDGLLGELDNQAQKDEESASNPVANAPETDAKPLAEVTPVIEEPAVAKSASPAQEQKADSTVEPPVEPVPEPKVEQVEVPKQVEEVEAKEETKTEPVEAISEEAKEAIKEELKDTKDEPTEQQKEEEKDQKLADEPPAEAPAGPAAEGS